MTSVTEDPQIHVSKYAKLGIFSLWILDAPAWKQQRFFTLPGQMSYSPRIRKAIFRKTTREGLQGPCHSQASHWPGWWPDLMPIKLFFMLKIKKINRNICLNTAYCFYPPNVLPQGKNNHIGMQNFITRWIATKPHPVETKALQHISRSTDHFHS